MSGFAVSAVRLALPDTGLISYGEMLDQRFPEYDRETARYAAGKGDGDDQG